MTTCLSDTFAQLEQDPKVRELVELYNLADQDLKNRGLEIYLAKMTCEEVRQLYDSLAAANLPARKYMQGEGGIGPVKRALQEHIRLGRRILIDVQNRREAA